MPRDPELERMREAHARRGRIIAIVVLVALLAGVAVTLVQTLNAS